MAVGLGAGVPTLERLSASAERVRWSAATRFIFRIWFVFTLLLIVPRSIEFLFNLGVWPLIVNWVGRWPVTHILHRPEHLLAGPMSGADFLPDFLAAAILGGASVVIALAWTLAAPERDHPVLFSWLTTVVRFLLGGLLLFYAWDKILPGQFGPGPNLHAREARRSITGCASCHREDECLACHSAQPGAPHASPHPPGWRGSARCNALDRGNRRVCLRCHITQAELGCDWSGSSGLSRSR